MAFFLLPFVSEAAHSCEVTPFSQSVTQGEKAVYIVNLKTASSTNQFEIHTGNLPNGVEREFIPMSNGITTPEKVTLKFITTKRSQTGPINMAIFYLENDGKTVNETKCLLELIVNKKNSLKSDSPSRSTNIKRSANAIRQTFSSKIQYGERGTMVVSLQNTLKELGYFPKEEVSTGYFGKITKEAVQSLQRANNLEPVGYLGPKTREFLNKKTRQ